MAAKISDDNRKILILVDQEEQGKKLVALEGFDKNGDPVTKELKDQAGFSNFLNINGNDSALEAFLKKFSEQAQAPSHTGLYLVTLAQLEKLIRIKDPEEFNKAIEPYKVDPKEVLKELRRENKEAVKQEKAEQTDQRPQQEEKKEEQTSSVKQDDEPLQQKSEQQEQPPNQAQGAPEKKQESFKFDPDKIEMNDLQALGITQNDFDKSLRAMLYGYKSTTEIGINPLIEGEHYPGKGRISLAEQPDGRVRVIPHYSQEKIDVEEPYMNTILPDDVKKSLQQTGHAGRIVDLEPEPGKIVPAYLSVDKITNQIEYLPVADFQLGQSVKSKELTPTEFDIISAGGQATIEKMTSRNNNFFDGHVRINASERNLGFNYDGLDRHRYAQENKQRRSETAGQSNEGKKPETASQSQSKEQDKNQEKKIVVRDTFLSVPLQKWQKEALQADKWTYLKDMKKGATSELRNGWVRPNHKEGRFDIYQYIPKEAFGKNIDLERKEGADGKPYLTIKGKEITPNAADPTKQTQSQSAPKPEQKPEQKRQQIAPPKKRAGKGQGI